MAVDGPTHAPLRRSDFNRVFAGVCGGLGDYFGLDATVIRIAWVLLTLMGGSGIALYLVMWWVIPDAQEQRSSLPIALMVVLFVLPFLCFMCWLALAAVGEGF